eukprot:604405-Ditylum_brightwellii.AAC.1
MHYKSLNTALNPRETETLQYDMSPCTSRTIRAVVLNDALSQEATFSERKPIVEGQFDDAVDGQGQFDDASETEDEVFFPHRKNLLHQMNKQPLSLTPFNPSNEMFVDTVRSIKTYSISREALSTENHGIVAGKDSGIKMGNLTPIDPTDMSDTNNNRPLVVSESEITAQDVLCGRGGRTNHHFGNKYFRTLVDRA